jgi:hypothetical protein
MGGYGSSRPSHDPCRVTLETLKEQMYSLNMRLRLSMQTHDETTQLSLEQQINELHQKIEAMQAGNYKG